MSIFNKYVVMLNKYVVMLNKYVSMLNKYVYLQRCGDFHWMTRLWLHGLPGAVMVK